MPANRVRDVRDEYAAANKRAKEGAQPELKELLTDILSDGAGGSEIPKFIRMPRYEASHNEGVFTPF